MPPAVTAAAANPSSSPAAAPPDEDAPLLSPPVSRDAFLSAAVEDGVRTPLNMLIRAPAGVQQQLQRAGLAGDAAVSSSWRLLQHPGGAAAASYAGAVSAGSPGDGGAVTLNELVKLKAAAEAAAADAGAAEGRGDALAAYQRYADRMAGYLSAQLSHADNMKVSRGKGTGRRAARRTLQSIISPPQPRLRRPPSWSCCSRTGRPCAAPRPRRRRTLRPCSRARARRRRRHRRRCASSG